MSDTMTATATQVSLPSFGVEPAVLPRDGSSEASEVASGRLYMTADLRAATGLTRTHLDYYLREGLIVPTTRSESGYLLFNEAELNLLRSIIADRAAGVPLREIRSRLGR
jgi:hypothetical protein